MAEPLVGLSDGQEKLLSLLPIIPSILSVLASAAIIRLVVCDSCKSSYKRILLGLSCCDVVSSVTYIFQAFLVPRETSNRVWAVGTDETCTMVGAFAQFGLSAFWYNLMLSIYYCATIRFGMTEETFQKRLEPWLHMICIGFPFATAVAGVIIGVYHEMDISLGCWVSDYPRGCDDDPNESCQSVLIGIIFAGFPFIFQFIMLVINNTLIYLFVRKNTHLALRRATFAVPNVGLDRIRSTAVQACLYVGAFAIVTIWGATLRFLEGFSNLDKSDSEVELFPLLILQSTFMPMLGVFNLLVFVRPRYLQRRRTHAVDESWYKTLWRVIIGANRSEETTSTQFALFTSRFRHHRFRSSYMFPPPVQYVLARISGRAQSSQEEVKRASDEGENPTAENETMRQASASTIAADPEKQHEEEEGQQIRALSSGVAREDFHQQQVTAPALADTAQDEEGRSADSHESKDWKSEAGSTTN